MTRTQVFQITLAIGMAGMLSPEGIWAQQPKFQQLEGPQGLVVMEAENFSDMVLRVETYWEYVYDPEGFSGTAAMQALPAGENRHKNYADAELNAPYLEYPIVFVKAEPVYVWGRASHLDGYDDSVWFGLDDAIVSSPLSFTTEEQVYVDTWHWIRYRMDNARAMLNIPSTGVHVVRFYMREPSFKLDKILLTTDPDYVPEGVGPAETLAGEQAFHIVIDAQKDPWFENLTGPENGLVYLPGRCYLRDIGTGPEGDDDLSAVVWTAWDEEYLYFYAEVKDDMVTASNTARFQNDCIELKFDPNPSEGTGEKTSNARLTALGADRAEQQSGVDNLNGSGNLVNEAGEKWIPTEADYARRLTDDGYAVEFRIPRAYINVPGDNRFMVWGENQVFGMAINIGDNDGTSRDNMLQWSAGHTDQVHSYARYHGAVTFLPNHMLRLEAISPRDPSIVNDSAAVWYVNPNTAVRRSNARKVEGFQLLTNYPNPFNPATRIVYRMDRPGSVSLAIYNLSGERIRMLVTDDHTPGIYEVSWDGRDSLGRSVPSGMYLCKMQGPSTRASIKIMLMR